ncbi:MAG: universal stress protein [Beijerinckiaceae bacterium]
MTSRLRRSFEPGHKPKFLVIIDESEECGRAVRFASRRVVRTGARLLMLAVTDKADFQHWLGVGDLMQEEANERANDLLQRHVATCRNLGVADVETSVRTGKKAEQILRLIEEDLDVSFLVLGAGSGADGPGPLVSMLASRAAFPIPVVVVPGQLSDAEIDALA